MGLLKVEKDANKTEKEKADWASKMIKELDLDKEMTENKSTYQVNSLKE